MRNLTITCDVCGKELYYLDDQEDFDAFIEAQPSGVICYEPHSKRDCDRKILYNKGYNALCDRHFKLLMLNYRPIRRAIVKKCVCYLEKVVGDEE